MFKLSFFIVISFSVLAAPQETSIATDLAKKATIEGVIVNEVTKRPVHKAEVKLYKQGKMGEASSGESAYSVVTDAAGKFRIDNIEPGEYTLIPHKAGFFSTRAYFGLSARDLKLAAGVSLTDLRYALLPQAIITGRVTEGDGEPVQNALVVLLRYRYDRGSYRTLQVGLPPRTNDLGEFRFVDVPPGKYYLVAVARRETTRAGAPGGLPTVPDAPRIGFVPTYHLNASGLADATRIEVQAGQELSGRDIVLRKEKVVRVSGKVVDADGSPVRNAAVSLTPADALMGPAGGIGLLVDDQGTFAADSVPPGQYLAHAIMGDQSNWQSADIPVAVGDSGAQNIVLQIQPTKEVKGTLVLEGSDRKDFDFSGFSITMRPGDGNSAYVQDARPKPDGKFTLSQIAPGRYVLNISPRSGEGYVKSILFATEDVYGKEVEASAVAAGGLKIVIRLDSASVSGTVEIHEERKAALRSPSVVLLSTDARFRVFDQRHVARLNQNNRYELKDLRPGDYIAFAFEDFDYPSLQDPEVLAAVASKGTKVSLEANESKALDLTILPWPEQFADRLQ